MPSYISFPFDFLKFWYFSAPKEILLYFFSLNHAFLQLFSLTLLLRTFFHPIKNEYRKGLVAFSIGLGMFVKFWIILVDLVFLIVLICLEIGIFVGFLLWPLATIWLLLV